MITSRLVNSLQWIDHYGQWFCIYVVYRWEFLCLIAVACAVAVRRRNIVGMVLFYTLWIWLIYYLFVYHMNRYSRVAWPITVAAGSLLVSGWWWYVLARCWPSSIREGPFHRYIRSDPRMGLYLDAVRSIRTRGIRPRRSFLSLHRLEDPDLPRQRPNLWAKLFRVSQRRGIRRVLRFLACREQMPSLRSAFVLQRVEEERQRVWSRYASARYGQVKKASDEEPLSVYQAWVAQYGGLPLPPESHLASLRPLRVSWLALTEGLAECRVFLRTRESAKPRTRLGLLIAAELLGQAGEAQHQIVRDLARSQPTDADDDDLLRKETNLAVHFLDLAARCTEQWLAPGSQDDGGNRSLLDRYEQFCGSMLNGAFNDDLLEHRLRSVLLYRYPLIARLKRRLPENVAAPGYRRIEELDERWQYRLAPEPNADRGDAWWSFEAAMAQLTCYGAFISLCLEKRRGDLARSPWLTGRVTSGDSLTAFAELMNEVIGQAELCGAPLHRVRDSERHIRQLSGRAFEQEMEHLHPGSPVWWELCLSAADLYHSCDSSRIRMLCAIAQDVLSQGADAPSSASLGIYDDIIELA